MKKFLKKIANGCKKFYNLITNKWLLKGTTTLIVVAIVIACYIGINLAVKQARIDDLDFSEEKLYSISDATRKRLNALNAEITIQLINLKDYNHVLEYADKYRKASDKINVEEVNDLSARVDLQNKYNIDSNGNLIVIKNGDREKALTLYDLYQYESSSKVVDSTEEAILNAIIEVTIEEKPHIYVLTGRAYNQPTSSLGIIANKLMEEANEIELLDMLTEGKIPENCDCLIITTLVQDFSEFERDKIIEYINNGGKILMLTSQGALDFETPNFDKILEQYGITIGYGSILEQDDSKMLYNASNLIIAEAEASFMGDLDKNFKLLVLNPGKIQFVETTKLEELGVTYETIASTSEKSFVRTKFDIETPSRTENDSEEGASIIGALVSKKISEDKKSELIIFSDETFVMPFELEQGKGFLGKLYDNENVVMNSISYLTEREDTITIRKTYETETLTFTEQEEAIIKTIIFVVPVLIIGAGIVVWLVRRRQY